MQVSRLISGRVENSQSMTGKSSHGWDIPGLRGHGGGGGIGESSGSAVTLGTRAGMWVPGRRGPPEKSGALRAQCPAVHTSRGPSLYQAVEQEGRLVSLGRTPPISARLPTFLTMLFMWPNPDTCLPKTPNAALPACGAWERRGDVCLPEPTLLPSLVLRIPRPGEWKESTEAADARSEQHRCL